MNTITVQQCDTSYLNKLQKEIESELLKRSITDHSNWVTANCTLDSVYYNQEKNSITLMVTPNGNNEITIAKKGID